MRDDDRRRQQHNEPTRRADAARTMRAGAQSPPPDRAAPTRAASERQTGATRHALGDLGAGTELWGRYTVRQTIRPHESAQPGVYLCDGSDGPRVLKVAATRLPPKPEMWALLATLDHPHVVRTLRCFEADGLWWEEQEYYPGGTLATPADGLGELSRHTPTYVERVVLPQMAAALSYLHQHGLAHRDVKPENIYRAGGKGLGERLVLGDFDISTVLTSGHTSRETERLGGTWGYTSPEALPRLLGDDLAQRSARVTAASDYYSLGVTLIELLLGTHPLRDAFGGHMTQDDVYSFYMHGNKLVVPTGIPDRLQMLLRGLLIRDYHHRWGPDEVERGLAGRSTEADQQKINADESYVLARSARPYTLGEKTAHDLPSLAAAMLAEPELAKADLLRRDFLVNWIAELDTAKGRQVDELREQHRAHPEVAWLAAMLVCDANCPFPFPDGRQADSLLGWIEAARAFGQAQHLDDGQVCTDDCLRQLEVWLTLGSVGRSELAPAVRGLLSSKPAVRLEALHYLFDSSRPFCVGRREVASTPAQLARWAYGRPGDWAAGVPHHYEQARQVWADGFVSAWLRQRGLAALADRAEQAAAGLAGEPAAVFETVLRLLDPQLAPVQVAWTPSATSFTLTTPYGEQRTLTCTYHTVGGGVPFGAFSLDEGQEGLALEQPTVRAREGAVELVLDGRQGLPVARRYQAKLKLTSGVAALQGGPATVAYTVAYPLALTLQRVLTGALVGALALALPRALLATQGHADPVALGDLDGYGLWLAVTEGKHLPSVGMVLCCAAALGGFYAVFRLWLVFLRRAET